MARERTLAIVKPDAVQRNLIGEIIRRIEQSGLQVAGARFLRLSRADAEGFYAVHRERPFFGSLVEYMCSGPVMVLALEGDNAIKRWRDLMGATDPAKAEPGTIRKDLGQSVEANATHGSDAPETARDEIAYFFRSLEVIARG
jgi:nucleoside-diphosphate kinase